MTITESIEKDLIMAMEHELLVAMKNIDIQKLDELLHEDLLFNIPSGQTITKSEDLESYRSGNMSINEIFTSEQKTTIIGDTAIVSATLEMKGSYINYTLDGKYKIIRVWKLFNNQLKVIAGSSLRLP